MHAEKSGIFKIVLNTILLLPKFLVVILLNNQKNVDTYIFLYFFDSQYFYNPKLFFWIKIIG